MNPWNNILGEPIKGINNSIVKELSEFKWEKRDYWENIAKHIDVLPQDVKNKYYSRIFPEVKRVYAKTIARDLVSVIPM